MKQEKWEVEVTDEFNAWWNDLTADEQGSINSVVRVLEEKGPRLKGQYSSEIKGSRHGHMRELRIQHRGRPFRILYAFDPRRVAILLLGGDKTGDDDWYDKNVPIADRLYDVHLKELEDEEKDDG